MSLKKIFLKTKFTYKFYLYYNLYIRHKCFINRKQYSQWGEDEFISNYFKDKSNGFYLDIGCFHPFAYNNTCLLHKKGWQGVNIDINQTSIDLFNIARPKDKNFCTTIDEKKRSFKVYFDSAFSPINTLDKEFYLNSKNVYFKNKKEFFIKSKTIDEIISLSEKRKIDFVNIDVEGSDFNILKQINLRTLQVKLVSIETHHVDGSKAKNYDLISSFFEKNNFFLVKKVGPTSLYGLKD